MYVGVARYDLHLLSKPGSLKEKRSVVRRLRDRIRSRCRISASEVDAHPLHHRAVLGVACVGADAESANSLLESADRIIQSEPEVEVLEREVEVETW